MKTHISLRLSHDVLQEIDGQAKAEDRTRAYIIERALRETFGLEKVSEKPGGVVEVPAGEPLYRECKHGKNQWTCEMVACKILTNRT